MNVAGYWQYLVVCIRIAYVVGGLYVVLQTSINPDLVPVVWTTPSSYSARDSCPSVERAVDCTTGNLENVKSLVE